MKLAAITVVFNPNIRQISDNIKTYIDNVDVLIVYQNSLIEEELYKEFNVSEINLYSKKIIFLGDGKNIGIASALNEGIKWSIDTGHTHIITFDQDSYFKSGVLEKYKNLIMQSNFTDIGVYGVNPRNWGNLLFSVSDLFIEVSDTITSGSVFPSEVFLKCGFFEDDLFIDAVDYEFCFRIKDKYNLKTIVFPSIILEHEVGENKKTGLGFQTENYSAFRTYFIIRNQTNIWLRYPVLFSKEYKKVLILSHIFKRIIKIVLAEDNKSKKIKSIVIGLIHGMRGKLGMYKV